MLGLSVSCTVDGASNLPIMAKIGYVPKAETLMLIHEASASMASGRVTMTDEAYCGEHVRLSGRYVSASG